jgi:hypothetical protein
MPRRAPACERLPVGVRKHPCVRVHAPSHCRASALAARGREYSGSTPAVAQRRGVLGIVRSTPMEGVCALRHGRSTFRRPGTKRARAKHPLEHPCAVPSRTKTHAADACCAGVSALHGPVHEDFAAQRHERCTTQVFRLELARRHDPRRAVGAQDVEFPVRPPRARCRAVRLRLSAAAAPDRCCPPVPLCTFGRLRTRSAPPSSTRVQYPLGRRPMRPPRAVLV